MAALALCTLGLALGSTLRAADSEKWISLFDGKTLKGWKLVQGKAKFEAEFRCEAGINSGVNFRSLPADDKVKRVYGLQYEFDPTPRALTGGVQEEGGYGRRGKDNWLAPDESNGPLLAEWQKKHGDQFKPWPAWNTMRIEVRGPKIKTWLNGHLLADISDDAPVAIPRGFFGLQVHATKDKALFNKAVAFRNLRVQKLE